MAFTLIPKTAKDFEKGPFANKQAAMMDDVILLFEELKKLDPEPIAIDPTGASKEIRIRRSLMGKFAQEVLDTAGQKQEFSKKLKSLGIKSALTLKWGDGSRGNKGSNNRGLGFEAEIVHDFEAWRRGDPILKKVHETFILSLIKTYDLTRSSRIEILPEGALNQSRPLHVGPGEFYVGGSLDFNIGKTVTDITVKRYPGKTGSTPDKTVYLSLKRGDTVAYFGSGITKFLNEADTKKGKYSREALLMFKYLGIDAKLFAATFVPETPPSKPIACIKNAKVDLQKLQQLIRSGIGYGFHMVHLFDKKGGYIKHFEVNRQYADMGSKIIGPVTIFYGGSASYSKSIRIVFATSKYRKVELFIRNKSNSRMFPTILTSNFYYA